MIDLDRLEAEMLRALRANGRAIHIVPSHRVKDDVIVYDGTGRHEVVILRAPSGRTRLPREIRDHR